jgi:hypothetical protein
MVLMAMAATQDSGEVEEDDVVWEGNGWLVRTGRQDASFDGDDDEGVVLVHADVMWPAMEMAAPLVSKGHLLFRKHPPDTLFAFAFCFCLVSLLSLKRQLMASVFSSHCQHLSGNQADAVPLGALSRVESWPSHSSPDPTLNPVHDLSRATEANRIISGLFSSYATEAREKIKMERRGRLDMNALLMASRRPPPQVPSPRIFPFRTGHYSALHSPAWGAAKSRHLTLPFRYPPISAHLFASYRPRIMMTLLTFDRRTWGVLMLWVYNAICHYPNAMPRVHLLRARLPPPLSHPRYSEMGMLVQVLAELKESGWQISPWLEVYPRNLALGVR